jgi:hypothetical protein
VALMLRWELELVKKLLLPLKLKLCWYLVHYMQLSFCQGDHPRCLHGDIDFSIAFVLAQALRLRSGLIYYENYDEDWN